MFGGVRTSLDRLSTGGSDNEDLMTSGLMKLGHVPPSGDPSPSDVDSFWAREMGQLSVQERTEALNDLHGVVDKSAFGKSSGGGNEKCPENDNSSNMSTEESKVLEELDVELDRLPEKATYNQALLQNASYVKDVKLRLMMIRATNYQAAGAAQLFERFLAKKMELFSVEKLTKYITIEDLMVDENDRKVLESGMFQVLSSPDMAGRAVFCVFPYSRPEGSPLDSVLRCLWYMDMVATQDNEETQKSGQVKCIFRNVGQGSIDRSMVWSFWGVAQCLPSRLASFHYCYDDVALRPLLSLFTLVAAGTFVRARMRTHYGTHQECRQLLAGYGIPEKLLPFTEKEGEMFLDFHQNFLNRIKVLEQQQLRSHQPTKSGQSMPIVSDDDTDTSIASSSHSPSTAGGGIPEELLPSEPENSDEIEGDTRIIPSPNDCLLGKRGKAIWGRPGNVLYTKMIDLSFGAYEQAPKFGKQEIVDQVIQTIWDSGGMFLNFDQDTGDWIELVDQVALRDKVSHAYRNKRRDLRVQQKKQGK